MNDWRKKSYHLGDETTSKRWKRRPRLVAREFASAESWHFSHQRLQVMYWTSTHNLLAESQWGGRSKRGRRSIFSDIRLSSCERRFLANSTGETFENEFERRRVLGEKEHTWTESRSKSMLRLLYRVLRRGTQLQVQCWVSTPGKKWVEYPFDSCGWLDFHRLTKVHQWNLSSKGSKQVWHQCGQNWEDRWRAQFCEGQLQVRSRWTMDSTR